MKNILLTIFAIVMTICSLQAQNDTLFIMRSGSVIGKYKTTEVDSVIFYRPASGSSILYSELYRKWEVQSGMLGTKFIIIKSDNSFSLLNEDATWGFRSIVNNMALITGTQLSLNYNLYNYSINKDILTLTSTNGNVEAKRNDTAPEISQWVNYVSSLDSMLVPNPIGDPREDIGFDGQNILYTDDANSYTLYKINVNTKAVVSLALKFNAYYTAASYANNSIWLLNHNSVSKINTDGSISFTSALLKNGDRVDGGGFAYDGTNFYCSSRDSIYCYNIASNSWTSLYNIKYLSGMEYVGGYLYVIKDNAIHKCTTSPFKVVKTYYIKSAGIITGGTYYGSLLGGITHDGTNFWVTLSNRYTNKLEIHKVNLN